MLGGILPLPSISNIWKWWFFFSLLLLHATTGRSARPRLQSPQGWVWPEGKCLHHYEHDAVVDGWNLEGLGNPSQFSFRKAHTKNTHNKIVAHLMDIASKDGSRTYRSLSNWPGCNMAGSINSGQFIAVITKTLLQLSNCPFQELVMPPLPLSPWLLRFRHRLSNSSKKMMQGLLLRKCCTRSLLIWHFIHLHCCIVAQFGAFVSSMLLDLSSNQQSPCISLLAFRRWYGQKGWHLPFETYAPNCNAQNWRVRWFTEWAQINSHVWMPVFPLLLCA